MLIQHAALQSQKEKEGEAQAVRLLLTSTDKQKGQNEFDLTAVRPPTARSR